MFDASDKQNNYNLNILRDTVSNKEQNIIFWVGAGASAWRKYLMWGELASSMHSHFLKYEAEYDSSQANDLLTACDYPSFFEYCKLISCQRYNNYLVDNLSLKENTPVYDRFIATLQEIKPIQVLTTNVDTCLESSLKNIDYIERDGIGRLQKLAKEKKSFICKLHGSISSINSVIFTKNDYEKLISDEGYIENLKFILHNFSVIFLGYSVSDKYVIELLKKNYDINELFGSGPHFLVTSSDHDELPPSVKLIKYSINTHHDHRSAILVADIIRSNTSSILASSTSEIKSDINYQSAFYVSDIYPPGTWNSSQTLGLDNKKELTVGTGFINGELADTVSTAMHDLVVGLICFDQIYLPLSSISRVHALFGSALFWHLVGENILKFIHHESQPSLIYQSKDDLKNGDLCMVESMDRSGTQPRTVNEIISSQITPAPGHESVAKKQIETIEEDVYIYKPSEEINIASIIRGCLIHPHIKSVLGISDAILPTKIPRWHLFPVLRVAHIVIAGLVCDELNIPAIKVHFGGSILSGVVFSAVASKSLATEVASYVLTSSLRADLGVLVNNDPSILNIITKFRQTSAGVTLRKNILDELSINEGGEVVAAIDAGLKSNIPVNILENAREGLSSLLLAEPGTRAMPAVWGNARQDDQSLQLWRKRSASMFENYCKQYKLRSYDLCPCGSGEKIKFCCKYSLKV